MPAERDEAHPGSDEPGLAVRVRGKRRAGASPSLAFSRGRLGEEPGGLGPGRPPIRPRVTRAGDKAGPFRARPGGGFGRARTGAMPERPGKFPAMRRTVPQARADGEPANLG